MSADGTVRVAKFRVNFDVELYGQGTAHAYELALQRLDAMILKHQRERMGEALAELTLPTGGIDGEPHGDSLDGWRCVFFVKEIT